MIKVLIAEDELPLLRGIKNLVEKINPKFTVVKTAKNGKEAIEYIKNHNIDVLFTDINMPLIDGIGVLEYLYQHKPQIKTVVISGYDEFGYVKSAMKYNARDYILKPIDIDELSGLLSKLEKEIEKNVYLDRMKVLRNALIKKKVASNQEVVPKNNYMIYFCAGSFPITVCHEGAPGGEYWENNNLQLILEDSASELDFIWTFGGRSLSEQIAIIELNSHVEIQHIVDRVFRTLSEELPVTIATSEQITSVNVVKKVSGVLREKIRNHCVFGQGGVLNEGQVKKEYALEETDEEQLKYAIKKRDYGHLKAVMLIIKEKLIKNKIKQKQLEGILTYILLLMQNEFDNYDTHIIDLSVDELITNLWDYDSLTDDFLVVCHEFYSGCYFTSESNEELMENVDRYIKENISKQLSTKTLSVKFGLVAPYLSKLFKDYKGVSPSQYIQNTRLENAKKILLECPDMLIRDISEMVGYNDSLYFSKVFKKNFGVYPTKYREEYRD